MLFKTVSDPIGFNFVELLAQTLQDFNLPAHYFCIEVTETVAIENIQFTSQRLNDISKMGMHIALDDFGTGYSSLSYLKELPIDILKIDRSFIKDIETHPKDIPIIHAIVNMARQLDLKVVVEGVENSTQVELLKKAGCQYFQGFYYSRPAPALQRQLNTIDNNS